eukprot:m.249976 g.249976  ORF g.249976 m.249976 type:complete len:93 (+) comp26691_c0_seq10:144-422(+)
MLLTSCTNTGCAVFLDSMIMTERSSNCGQCACVRRWQQGESVCMKNVRVCGRENVQQGHWPEGGTNVRSINVNYCESKPIERWYNKMTIDTG